MSFLEVLVSVVTLNAAFRMAAPLLLGIAGFSFSNKAGILNLALESFMTFSAFFALWGSWMFHSAGIGALCGILAGLIFSALYGLFIFTLNGNGLITGVGFNLSAWGLTTMLAVAVFGTRSVTNIDAVAFQGIALPLRDGSFLDSILGNQTILVWIAPFLVLLSHWVMYKTKFGLRVRMVGLNPSAAETAGVSVTKYNWICMMISGVFTGLAGAFVSLNSLAMFTENMVAGRGFLILASAMVANGNPLMGMLTALLFAYAQACGLTLTGLGIQGQLVEMLPYIAVLLVMLLANVKNVGKAGEI